jgi:MFS family permease
LVKEFGIEYAAIGTLIGLQSLPGLFLSLPSGILGNRFGDKRVVLWGLVLMTIGTILVGFSHSFTMAATGRIISGIGTILLNVLMTKMVADWFAGKEINIAFIPSVGATQALGRLLGRSRALRYLYEGSMLSAREALEMGFVDFVVPAERLRGETTAYAAALAKKPSGALAAIRRCITVGIERPLEEALKLELGAAVALGGSHDFAEGLQAFLEKRAPKWE